MENGNGQVSEWKYVSLEMDGDVALLGLNRPEKRNAICEQLVQEIGQAVEAARRSARAGVVFGHGKHFCAGLDLAEFSQGAGLRSIADAHSWHDIFARIEFGKLPWFSALHGAVIGGGLELAAATHVRIADESAFFALPEGQRGIFVGGGGSVRISRLLGTARMMDLMLTGRTLSAEQGERWNLCQYVVPQGEALTTAISLARKAASNADLSNYAIINALPRIKEMPRDDGYFVELMVSSMVGSSAEASSRVNDFLSKRAPKVGAPELAAE